MVFTLYVAGPRYSGKTALCLSLYSMLRDAGVSVGYLKPVGQRARVGGPPVDPDVAAMTEAFDLREEAVDLCPVVLGTHYLNLFSDGTEAVKKKIKSAYMKAEKDRDVVIVEASQNPDLLASVGLDVASLAAEFGAKVIYSVRGEGDRSADRAVYYRDFLATKGVGLLGAVLNFVPFQQVERMRGVVSETLARRDVRVIGVVPDHRELTLPTVRDVATSLDAEVLAGKAGLDRMVNGYLVGAMAPEAAMSWLRRSVDKVFITGGDRADLVLMALETAPSAVILTGNIYPSAQVTASAERRGVPLLLVGEDTYTTVTKLEPLDGTSPITISAAKVELTRNLVGRYIDWAEALRGYVDLKKA